MELYQIRHFAAVADTGSFTKAGIRAGVSQPALSASVAKLEAELGVKLLHRTPGAIKPTLAGRRLLLTGREVLSACDRMKAEIKSADRARPVRVGVLRTLPTAHLARLIEALATALPGTTLELCDGTRDELQEKLLNRKIVACITSAGHSRDGQSSAVLAREHYGLAVGSKHRFASTESICLQDLHGEPFIVRTHCETYASTTKLLTERGISTHVVYKTDQDDRVLSLVAAGLGVALMPTLFATPDVRIVKVRDFTADRCIELQWNSDCTDDRLDPLIAFATSFNWRMGAGYLVADTANGPAFTADAYFPKWDAATAPDDGFAADLPGN
ncbi:LysR family transcriptional regulator [Beijerinckia sp. L45]|uniref:LysR family transcriptional regulator n=1 Tax=Beijerinckia sp. L45 TaxID=1641855 RepID=UPI00131B6663|nr:LysR family transcriptional regulator [Beijerinckia sp. L45]